MLTPKQEKFCQLVADGKTQADAYRTAYNSKTKNQKSIVETASQLMADLNVSSRVKELKEQLANKALWTREDSVNKLKEAFAIAEKATDLVAITKELNAMHGYNAPIKSEVEITGNVVVRNITVNPTKAK